MGNNLKATALVIALLVIGAVLGAVGQGILADKRAAELERLRTPGGFVEHMHDVIQPSDESQWQQIRPFIEAVDRANRILADEVMAGQRAALDSLRAHIDGFLSTEQRLRLDDFARRPPPGGDQPGRGGPPGLGPDGGRRGPPPDGRGPPPPRRGGPPQ